MKASISPFVSPYTTDEARTYNTPEVTPSNGYPLQVTDEHLPILQKEEQAVLDPRFKIFALLKEHPTGGRARIVHYVFSQSALRMLVPLLKSPYYCPYSYLKAAYEASWETLSQVLFAPSLEAVSPFASEVQRHRQRLETIQRELTRTLKHRPYAPRQKQLSDEWDTELRPVQRPMQEVMRQAHLFNFKVLPVRLEGYRLERLYGDKPIDVRYRAHRPADRKAG